MQLNRNTAVVDNDFLSHVAEARLSDRQLTETLGLIFRELGLCPVMHPLLYQYERLAGGRTDCLFDTGVIQKAEFGDLFQGEESRKQYYITYLVPQLYHALTGETYPVSGEQVLTYWRRQCCLGEVHSLAMCLLCGCGLFLSDDGDARYLCRYIRENVLGEVQVYDRAQLIDRHLTAGETALPRDVRKSLTHRAR